MILGLNGLTLVVAGVALLASFVGGIKVESWRRDARELRAQHQAEQLRRVDEARLEGVSAAYQGIADQLRRLATLNRVELSREITKVEYRCPVPAESQRLLDRAVDAANAAAAGREPAPAVPADRPPAGR